MWTNQRLRVPPGDQRRGDSHLEEAAPPPSNQEGIGEDICRSRGGSECLRNVGPGCHKGGAKELRGRLVQSLHRAQGGEREGVWQEIYSQSESEYSDLPLKGYIRTTTF